MLLGYEWWIPIKSIIDLPEDYNYVHMYEDDDDVCWEKIFNDSKDEKFHSSIEFFMLIDKYDRVFPAIGRVIFLRDADITSNPGVDVGYIFKGVAIDPNNSDDNENSYLSGVINAKPIAWMPIDYSPAYWNKS